MPRPLTQETDKAPITEQIVMYTRMLVCPWRGPTTHIRINDTMTTSVANTTKPEVGGKKKSCYLQTLMDTTVTYGLYLSEVFILEVQGTLINNGTNSA